MSEHEAREAIERQDEDRERDEEIRAQDEESDVEAHVMHSPQIRSPRD